MAEELVEGLPFPGADLFDVEEAKRLEQVIQNLRELQPEAVISICEKEEIGWDASGYPQATAIRQVEAGVKTRGCAIVALETARALGGKLTTEQVIGIVNASGRVYECIPQAVYQVLQPSA